MWVRSAVIAPSPPFEPKGWVGETLATNACHSQGHLHHHQKMGNLDRIRTRQAVYAGRIETKVVSPKKPEGDGKISGQLTGLGRHKSETLGDARTSNLRVVLGV